MLDILIVDDEPLARQRLAALLQSVTPLPRSVQQAASAAEAALLLQQAAAGDRPVDLLLLDIHMPGLTGTQWAAQLQAAPSAPALVFVTAHAGYAAQAFELEATDYLTKPVRLERLQQALGRVLRSRSGSADKHHSEAGQAPHLIVSDRRGTQRLPLAQVLLCRAELKYTTAVTASQQYLLDASLNELEQRYDQWFVRIHRNALAARHAIAALRRSSAPQEAGQWHVQLHGLASTVPVSRRALPAVRALLLAR